MKENIFKLAGVTYRVKKSDEYCNGCAFAHDEDMCMCVPACIGKYRKDGRTVIFVAQKSPKQKVKSRNARNELTQKIKGKLTRKNKDLHCG